ncbi:MAG: 4Fe-4S binding protein [Bacteroidetes bacterium]|nr:4Fe-4S binding protein [Bacteroidota bacterium]
MRLSICDANLCVGCQCCMFACSRRSGNAGLAESCIGVKSAGGISNGFKVVSCRSCTDPPCTRVCPTKALVPKEKGGVKLDKTKCIGCKNCVQACIIDAVFWNHEENKPVICVHCGYCVKFCPHKVLEMIN